VFLERLFLAVGRRGNHGKQRKDMAVGQSPTLQPGSRQIRPREQSVGSPRTGKLHYGSHQPFTPFRSTRRRARNSKQTSNCWRHGAASIRSSSSRRSCTKRERRLGSSATFNEPHAQRRLVVHLSFVPLSVARASLASFQYNVAGLSRIDKSGTCELRILRLGVAGETACSWICGASASAEWR
jgi:hypothetical protein